MEGNAYSTDPTEVPPTPRPLSTRVAQRPVGPRQSGYPAQAQPQDQMVPQQPPSDPTYQGSMVQERTNGGLIGGLVVAAIIAIIALGIAIGAITGHVKDDSIGAAEIDDTDSYTLGNLNVTHNTNLGTVGSDTTTITGDLVVGSADIKGNLKPDKDDSYDIGSQSYRWEELYLGSGGLSCDGKSYFHNTIYAGASIIPTVDNRWDLGSETHKFGNVYVHTVHGVSYSNSLLPNDDNIDTIGSGTSTWHKLYLGTGGISCSGPVEIGETLSVTGNTTINGGISVTGGLCCDGESYFHGIINAGASIIPTVDNRWAIGSESNPFSDIWATNLHGVSYTLNLIPDADNTDDIGTSILRFRKIYLGSGGISCSGPVDIGGTLSVTGHTDLLAGLSVIGSAAVTLDLDVSGTLIAGSTTINGGLSVKGGLSCDGDSYFHGTINAGASIIPIVNNRWAIGSESNRFSDIWATNVHGVSYTQNLYPDADNTDDIGTSILRYKKIYLGTGGVSCSGPVDIGGTLSVTGNAYLTTLDVTGHTGLLGGLSVIGNAAVTTLDVSGNADLTTLDVTGHTGLLGGLSVIGNAAVTTLDVSGNADLTTLDVTGHTGLLGGLSVIGNAAVTTLDVSGNADLTTLDVTGHTGLLGGLSVIGNAAVTTLDVSGNADLTTLDVTGHTGLLGGLSVIGNAAVTTLDVSGHTDLTTLDVTGHTDLLGGLSVTGNAAVTTLDVSGNADLTTLDVTGHTGLLGGLSVTGGLSCDGESYFNGTINAGASIIPIVDNRWNLGSEAFRFANVYGHTIHGVSYSNSLLPNESDVDTIGSDTSLWHKIYLGSGGMSCQGPVAIGGTLSVTGGASIEGTLIAGKTTIDGGISVINGGISVTGGVSIGDTLKVGQDATFSRDVTIDYDLTVGSALKVLSPASLTVTGNTLLGYTVVDDGSVFLGGSITPSGNTIPQFGVSSSEISLTGPTTFTRKEISTDLSTPPKESGGIHFITALATGVSLPGPGMLDPDLLKNLQEYTFINTALGASFNVKASDYGTSILGVFIGTSGAPVYSTPGTCPNIKLTTGSKIGDRLTVTYRNTVDPPAYYINEGVGSWEFSP